MTTTEVWKPIEGYEDYEVSNTGKVKSLISGKVLKQSMARGYPQVGLHKNKIIKTSPVHRLVAKAFIPNPENKGEVNHKDYDRTNNHVENLEWMTKKENINYSAERMRHPRKGGKTNTGEHHITFRKRKNLYRVLYWKDGTRREKQFSDFEKAKRFRDEAYQGIAFTRA